MPEPDGRLAILARALRSALRPAAFPDGRMLTVPASGGKTGEIRARDLALAAGGLLSEGLGAPVRAGLEALLQATREDGTAPARLPLAMRGGAFDGIDSNALVCWAASRYCLEAPDLDWAKEILPALDKTMAFYDSREKDRLVLQNAGADWKTSLSRGGAVFFTQLLRWQALMSLSELARRLGALKACASWQGQARLIGRLTRRAFWDPEEGFFRESASAPLLSCEGNLAAAAWGFADEEESSRLLRAIDRRGLNTPWGPAASEPFPARLKTWRSRLSGASGLHDACVWPWISGLALLALRRLGRGAAAEKLEAGLLELLAEVGTVPEALDKNGAPALPGPSAAGAGLLLEALKAPRPLLSAQRTHAGLGRKNAPAAP